ncbi:uncharacterized protein LOC143565804 [Bidens hawaiensis]|uniref:uncharacterized protein LOC143565804 n=1 Tax=Bidens hawaiensis TaxID=980011 RepID=UPI0040495585
MFKDFVMKLDLARKLRKQIGCVNSVSYNALGDILVSGSDDRKVILWDWESGSVKLSFDSGHKKNILQANIVPETDERIIVTCAADGQVRHASILECGIVETKLLGKHQGRAHKLANDTVNPHVFYTCGEDGLVQHFDLRTGDATELFKCQPVRGRLFTTVVHLTTIAIDPLNPNTFVVAGSDEFTRLYDIRSYRYDASTAFGEPVDHFCPEHLVGDENVGITGLSFSDQSELLVSYSEEFIYLFSKNMGRGSDINSILDHRHLTIDPDSEMEIDSKPGPQAFKGHRNRLTVKGVSFFGGNEYIASGSDCGRMFIWKKKDARLVRVMEADMQVVNCIQAHPHTLMLASGGIDHDIKIWTPTALEKAPAPSNINRVCMHI